MTEIAERYLAFWNTGDAGLAAQTFTDEVEYHAPITVLCGPSALIGFHEEFMKEMPGAEIVAREAPERHHDRVRVQWEIMRTPEESFATGTDVLVLDGDRVASVTTFLDRPPAGFAEHHP